MSGLGRQSSEPKAHSSASSEPANLENSEDGSDRQRTAFSQMMNAHTTAPVFVLKHPLMKKYFIVNESKDNGTAGEVVCMYPTMVDGEASTCGNTRTGMGWDCSKRFLARMGWEGIVAGNF